MDPFFLWTVFSILSNHTGGNVLSFGFSKGNKSIEYLLRTIFGTVCFECFHFVCNQLMYFDVKLCPFCFAIAKADADVDAQMLITQSQTHNNQMDEKGFFVRFPNYVWLSVCSKWPWRKFLIASFFIRSFFHQILIKRIFYHYAQFFNHLSNANVKIIWSGAINM